MIDALLRISGNAVILAALHNAALLLQVGQQIPDFAFLVRIELQKLHLRQSAVHGNIPQDAGGFLPIDLFPRFH